jgi:hypothetical protein
VTAAVAEQVRGLFPSPRVLAAKAATTARLEFEAVAVAVEAFAVSVVIGPDEPAPYYLTAMGEAVPPPDEPCPPGS